MKTTQGDASLAFANISLTLAAPTPTYISTNSEPDTYMKGTPDSPAIAFANIVLPVPEGPYRIAPFGKVAPIFLYFLLSLRKSTICSSSSFASSLPAMSANLTSDCSGSKNFEVLSAGDDGLLPPNGSPVFDPPPIEEPEPKCGPPCICFILLITLLIKQYNLHIIKVDTAKKIPKRRITTGVNIGLLSD